MSSREQISASHLARMIDHTLLRPEATPDQVARLCQEAREYHFASACVNPTYVRLAAQLLAGSEAKVCSVAGFPLGASTSETKAFEARRAIEDGAHEVDMVINVGALKASNEDQVKDDIVGVVEACHEAGALCKVIIEAGLLTEEEKRLACQLAQEAGADFVKTSTGFIAGGAAVEDVALMRSVVGDSMGVKASGGIKTYEQARALVEAGASRIGTSSGVQIMEDAPQ